MRVGFGKTGLDVVKLIVFSGSLAAGLAACQAPSVDGVERQRSALTGDTVATVALPAAAQCPVVAGTPNNTGIGTSVAIIPGGLLGLDLQYNTLMVTSCFSTGADRANLYVTDPLTGNLVTTITTSTAPPAGWGSLALRGNKGDLIGCGNDSGGTHGIYSINVNVNSATGAALGATTFLFNGASGEDICDGVSYDSSDDTVWMSPDVSPTVYHYSITGSLLASFSPPNGCPNSGIAVSGFEPVPGVRRRSDPLSSQQVDGRGLHVLHDASSPQRGFSVLFR